jgi:predicted dithiol-disulfide oxidoreductase (DUF899 family)
VSPQRTGTREEWLAARRELLAREKELTRTSDELARQRQELPWVAVEKDYVFETNDGPKRLAELFDGRSQLLVYHFMHGPLTPDGCPGCTFTADHFERAALHLNAHDVTIVLASRSPVAELNAYKERMGWTLPWVSSGGTEFNFDFAFYTDEEHRTGKGYNFGTPRRADLNLRDDDEIMGLSVFALEDGVVYHTYSTFDRGTDVLHTTWQLLDRTPRGREDEAHPDWPKRRDEYEVPA